MSANKKVVSSKAKSNEDKKDNISLKNENLTEKINQQNEMITSSAVSIEKNSNICKQKFLSVQNLSKTYIGGYSGINEITFDLNAGEQMVVVGDYSSGKTTILSLLAGLESISSGEVYLNGKLLNNEKIKERNIGYLDKKLQLDSTKKVKDIICYPLKLRKIDNNTIAEKLANIANAFEISGMLSKKVTKLTTYQKTIIALARLLICDRDLYLIDDIFDRLTTDEIEKIAKIIGKYTAGKTIIFAASSFATAEKLQADKLLMLAYSTMLYFGNIHNKESFNKTIAGYKLFKNKKICCVPAFINGDKLTIDGKQYDYNKQLVSGVFNKGVLLFDMDKISFNNNKKVPICAEIYYINKDKVAYLDINSYVATIYLENKDFKVGDKINFSFNQEDGILYDFESERKIST